MPQKFDLKLIHLQDWLGTSPVFFNRKTGQVSENINDLIDLNQLEFDPAGLLAYLRFGYCVFGRTPIKEIGFLRQNESIYHSIGGTPTIRSLQDPCLEYLEKTTPESTAWERLSESIEDFRKSSVNDRVCIPTSGGYDSRILNYLYPAKKEIRAFTYGISSRPDESFEAVNAKAVCERLGVNWELIELGEFNALIDDWIKLFGVSTHAHGMYHWEFYKKIRDKYDAMPLISGIIGDPWAGSVQTSLPTRPEDLLELGYSHGIHVDPSQCLLKSSENLLEREFEEKRDLLRNEKYRVLYLVRNKIILLSYLLRVPKHLGFNSFSPFTDLNVAMSMLTIEPVRWRARIWQRDFLQRHNLAVEQENFRRSFRNDLDFLSLEKSAPPPLDRKLLAPLFRSDYIDSINKYIKAGKFITAAHFLATTPRISRAFRILGGRDVGVDAYNSYLVIKPLEDLLRRQRAISRGLEI